MDICLANQAAALYIQKFGGTAHDKEMFKLIIEFLKDFPEFFSSYGKQADFQSLDLYIKLADKFFKARNKIAVFQLPQTLPDPMVSYILEIYFNYSEKNLDKIKFEHQLSMSAENIVGTLLERYIGTTLENYGWAWCAGDFVRAVDIIKNKGDGSWTLLQVKNRDNTENSSSSAIRHRTTIIKWFRSFSRKSTTN